MPVDQLRLTRQLNRYALAIQLGHRSTWLRAWLSVPGLLASRLITVSLVLAAARMGRMARRGRRLGRRSARRSR
jgi:hypothetical protein